MDTKELIAELAKIARARETVRKSLCNEAMKNKLLADLDEQEKKLGGNTSDEKPRK